MSEIILTREDIDQIENMLASPAFTKLIQVAQADYQLRWAAAKTPVEREEIWHLMHATEHVNQRLSDLVAGLKIQQKQHAARMKPSDADLLRPSVNGVVPSPFQV
jgi:hypothetical protein